MVSFNGAKNNNAILWDLDGTLCDNTHRTHLLDKRPVNWDEFFVALDKDTPIEPTVTMYRELSRHYFTIICTNRPRAYRGRTLNWLERFDLRPHMLLMRDNDDRRDDVDVKRDMVSIVRSGGLVPLLALDDRAPIAAMYRSLGIRCFHVAEGGEY